MSDRIQGVEAMFDSTNKGGSQTPDANEGVVSPYFPELSVDAKDEDLLQQSKDWARSWSVVETELKWRQKEVESYWLGRDGQDDVETEKTKPKADNLIYEALETFLPKATQKNPEPVVTADGTAEGDAVARTTEKMLASIAQSKDVDLRMTLRQVARFHQLYFLGAVQVGWSETTKNVTATARRPQKLVLDPNSTVENGAYTGKFLGVRLSDTASDILLRFPGKKADIDEACESKMATKLEYMEWWSDGEVPLVFWTMRDVVLGKMKNPHFNYPSQQPSVDEFGATTMQTVGGRNYFSRPRIPFEFLSITNLGQRPFDLTNGLYQCLSMQDVVSKRWRQIDRNADNTNNGLIASLEYFEESQAAQAAQALRNGDVMLQPKGIAGDGIKRDSGTPLPEFIYQNLTDARARILSVYGIGGSVPSFLQKDSTVRGKMITKSADDDRIGGGFTEYLEKTAARVYEQFVQFMYVYYDEPRYAAVVGEQKAMEYLTLTGAQLANVNLTVDVREGSMIPQDAMAQRQDAIELWGAGAIDPITLFTKLDYPNPRESAKLLFQWQNNPASLFPEVAALMPQPTAAAGAQPAAQPTASGPPSMGNPSTDLPLPPV